MEAATRGNGRSLTPSEGGWGRERQAAQSGVALGQAWGLRQGAPAAGRQLAGIQDWGVFCLMGSVSAVGLGGCPPQSPVFKPNSAPGEGVRMSWAGGGRQAELQGGTPEAPPAPLPLQEDTVRSYL